MEPNLKQVFAKQDVTFPDMPGMFAGQKYWILSEVADALKERGLVDFVEQEPKTEKKAKK